jgi:TonB family protein
LLRSIRMKLHKDVITILVVLSMHLMLLLAASLYTQTHSVLLSREIMTLNLLVDSSDGHIPTTPKKTLGLSIDSKDSTVAAISVSTAGQSDSTSPSSSLMGKGIQSREQFSNPRPPYPLASRRMGEQGAVDLQLCLSQQGDVESVAVIKSSGYRRLDQSALETVKTWKFSALEMVTAPSSDCYRLPIQFRLEA